MTRRQTTAMLVHGVLALSVRFAGAQVTIEPAAPRWGQSITITVEPNRGANEGQRVDPGEQLYAVLNPFQRGPARQLERLWMPMKWDGSRFVARMTVPRGCEAGSIRVATPERVVDGATAFFVCSTAGGARPPGALIVALAWGGRDTANWKAEVAEDLAALRTTDDHGWGFAAAWLFRIVHEPAAFTPEDLLRDVERVDHEETRRTPGLLNSLVWAYNRAGDTARAFERLKEACDRYPESPLMARDAFQFASAAVATHPEFLPELGGLLARVAARAPQNPGLRGMMSRLTTNVPAVPLSTIREIAKRWIADYPDQMAPHYLLAHALSRDTALPQREAEALVSTAIDLSLQPHPVDFGEGTLRPRAFALRSRLRSARGDLVGALADARMAQLVARDKAGAEDLAVEAGIWQRLGHTRRAEALAVDAFRAGSLEAEPLLKALYVARTGSDPGFGEYLIARLREGPTASIPALRPTPAFSATTLDGASIEASSLAGRVTVLDFWFIGCPGCQAERPKLNAIVDEFGDKVRFVGFALNSAEALKKYVAETPFKFEIVAASQEIATAFGVDYFPRHMVIDRSGKIVWLSGTDGDQIERLRAMISRVLASEVR